MVAEFLKELKKTGWKQKDIAMKAGIAPSFLSELKNGDKCGIDTIIKLADAFNVSVDEVLGRKKPRIRSPIIEKIEEIAGNDEEVARAALKCAQDEKLLKEVRGKGGREKAA